jgi:hypothetical protein
MQSQGQDPQQDHRHQLQTGKRRPRIGQRVRLTADTFEGGSQEQRQDVPQSVEAAAEHK